MVLHTLNSRRAGNVISFKTGRPIHPDSAAAFAKFDRQRSVYNDRLAALAVEADNMLIAVAADLVTIDQDADATDAESCMIRRALVRRAGAAILRYRRSAVAGSAQVGSAS